VDSICNNNDHLSKMYISPPCHLF